jgi:hypothetical protein
MRRALRRHTREALYWMSAPSMWTPEFYRYRAFHHIRRR